MVVLISECPRSFCVVLNAPHFKHKVIIGKTQKRLRVNQMNAPGTLLLGLFFQLFQFKMKVKKKRRNRLIFLCLSVGISTYADIGRNTYKVSSNLRTEAFVQEGLDEAFSLYIGSGVSYISDAWVGLRLRQVIWLV